MEGGEEGRVCCGHNGTLWLEVAVHGRAAHGSRPDLGVNALEKMSALVLALLMGPRRDYKPGGGHAILPNNLTLTLTGAGLLWFGWIGFNCGSGFSVGSRESSPWPTLCSRSRASPTNVPTFRVST